MSHQVVLTFDVDENKVQENAEKEAGRQIAKQVIEHGFGPAYNRDSLMKNYVYSAIKEILAPQKDEIIADAIKEVVGNLHKTKVAKERLAEALDGEKGS